MKVAVLMGSASDNEHMAPAVAMLTDLGIAVEEHVMSAHRTPDRVQEFTKAARANGFAAIICGAGMAAHLAGVVAAHTTLPVIGVPLASGALDGVDALYATVQMPTGIPVATVAIGGAANAAVLAVELLAVTDDALATRLAEYRKELANR